MRFIRFGIILACLALRGVCGEPLLQDTAVSFASVVKNAYVLSHMDPNSDNVPEISDFLEDKIGFVSRGFEAYRGDDQFDLSAAKNCHIVCAMLGELLRSGCKELVELYYYFIDSYQKNPDFLKAVTGYDWDRTGQKKANPFEQRVYDAGYKMRRMIFSKIKG